MCIGFVGERENMRTKATFLFGGGGLLTKFFPPTKFNAMAALGPVRDAQMFKVGEVRLNIRYSKLSRL